MAWDKEKAKQKLRKAESFTDRALHWLIQQDYTAIIVAVALAVLIVWVLKF